MGEKVTLSFELQHRLGSLVSQAAELDAGIKFRSTQLDTLKQEIRDLIELYKDQIPMVASSRVIPLSTVGKTLRVTYTTSAPRLDYDALRDKVGVEIFARITNPTAWELDVEQVNAAINEEAVTESELQECLSEPPMRKPSVSWDVMKGAAVGNEEE